MNRSFPLKEILANLDVTVRGDDSVLLSGVNTLKNAVSGQISFLTNVHYRSDLSETNASVVIVRESDAALCKATAVICKNPHYVYAKVTQFFERMNRQSVSSGIHPSAVIASDASIPASCSIGAGAVIESGVLLGENVVIGAQCFLGEGVSIGQDSILHPRVTIYSNVKIGERAYILSGAVIGSDGFGFALEKQVWHRVVQFGSVVIGDDVDIGANTTIDRGAIGDTVIENGVKLDNQIQIAHNVHIGEGSILAGCAAVAGSTTLGKHCMVGGDAKFAGHLTIADNVIINGGAGITSSIHEPGMYATGLMGVMKNFEWRKMCAYVHRLTDLFHRVKELEKSIKQKEVV